MIQAAHFDIKTVTGLRQALVLSAEYENEPFPLQDYTLHGSIGTYPRQDLKCSVDENGRARIEWDSVPPGNWKYDVFLVSSGNDETPLMEGTFTALPRITPVLDDEAVNDEVGGVLHLPSGNEGVITLEVDGGFVSKNYAAIAKDAADRAEQALKDIKQALQGVVTSLGGESGDILLDSGLKITRNAKENSVSLSLDDKTVVLTAGSQTIDGVKTFTGNITVNSSGNNGTLTLYTSGGTGYLSMDTGEMVIPTDLLTITGQTNIQTLNVAESALFTGGVTISQHLSANTIRSSTLETVGIDLRGSDDLDCISLTAFYDSPDEVELIIRPNHLSTDTNDYDVRLYLTCSSRGSYVDWRVGALIQAMRFHPAVEFYNSVKVAGAALFLGSTTINALLKASQIETDSLEIKDEAYPEGFLCYCDTGGLSMTRPSISESLWDADNPKAILNRSDNDQRYLQVKSLTAAEYEALGSYDPATMYRITDLEPAVVYLGTLKLSLAT